MHCFFLNSRNFFFYAAYVPFVDPAMKVALGCAFMQTYAMVLGISNVHCQCVVGAKRLEMYLINN